MVHPIEAASHSLCQGVTHANEGGEPAFEEVMSRALPSSADGHLDLSDDDHHVAIDDAVLRALALQAPVAEDLRQVLAIKMVATDLERVGDLMANVAEDVVYLVTGEIVRHEKHADSPRETPPAG